MTTATITETLYRLIDEYEAKIDALTHSTALNPNYAAQLAALSNQQHGMRVALSAITGTPVRDL